MEWETLPNELLHCLFLRAELKTLHNLVRVNRRFYAVITDDFFWKNKCLVDFGSLVPDSTWNETYKNALLGNVFVFGENSFGELGLKGVRTQRTPALLPGIKARDVAVGEYHSLVLDIYGNVYSFGLNRGGCLGIGEENNSFSTSEPIMLRRPKGKAVFAKDFTSYIIDLEDNLWAFGDNYYGLLNVHGEQIPTPTCLPGIKAKTISIAYDYVAIIDPDHDLLILERGQVRSLGIKAKSVVAKDLCVLIIDLNNDICVYRRVTLSGLIPAKFGRPLPKTKIKSLSSSMTHTLVIDTQDNLWHLKPDLPVNLRIKAKQVITINECVLFVDPDDRLWIFGSNVRGTLGLGIRYFRETPTCLSGLKVKTLSVSSGHTLVVGKKGRIGFFGSFLEYLRLY